MLLPGPVELNSGIGVGIKSDITWHKMTKYQLKPAKDITGSLKNLALIVWAKNKETYVSQKLFLSSMILFC